MTQFYVDTGYWVALAATLDQGHANATSFARTLSTSDKLITSEFVLLEFLNYFSERGAIVRKHAASFVHRMEQDSQVHVVPLSRALYRKGFEMYDQFADKGWSLSDCTSFLIMKEMGLVKVLTFDHHFEQARFQSPLSHS